MSARRIETDDELDAAVVKSAEREAEAQLEIVRALGKLRTADDRRRVMEAVMHIMEAEARVPGVMEAVSRGMKN